MYLWRYPAYVNLLNIVDLVSVSYPPVSLIPQSMVLYWYYYIIYDCIFPNRTFKVLAGEEKKTGQTVDFPNTILCYDETKNKAQPIVGERESRVSEYKKLLITTTHIMGEKPRQQINANPPHQPPNQHHKCIPSVGVQFATGCIADSFCNMRLIKRPLFPCHFNVFCCI